MTDRYLFRGKRISDGEWLQGSLLSCKRMTIGGSRTKEDFFEHHIAPWDYDGFELVDPATIGQCSGLRDKNGTLIFEGDVVKVDLDWPPGGENSRDGVDREVIFHKGIYSITSKPFIENLSHRPLCDCYNVEIIGNIHDTPSLLSEVAL